MSVFTDSYQIVNDVIEQLSGGKQIAAVDTTSFIAVGKAIMQYPTDNIYGALTDTWARTIFAARKYESYRFKSMVVDEERWGEIARKISFQSLELEASKNWNTDIAQTQLADDASIDPFKIRKAKPVEFNFSGSKPLQSHITHFRDELVNALRSEEEFMRWYDAKMIEYYNDITQKDEAEREMTALNFIAGTYAMASSTPDCVVDLAAAYNIYFRTAYTRAQLLTTYFDSFMKWTAARIQLDSKKLKDRTYMYHANVTNKGLKRFTPTEKRKMIISTDFLSHAKAEVYSALFNPEYLDLGEYEEINYWQNPKNPTEINCKPAYLDVSDGSIETADEAVVFDYFVGILYDEDALVISNKRENSASIMNPSGNYVNDYIHWLKRYNNDFTENHIIYYIGVGGETNKEAEKTADKKTKAAEK